MALVVLLRGVNVGGHRAFSPTALARQMAHLGAVSIGSAGTFVFRRPVSRALVRAELARRLPFDAEIVICGAREMAGLLSRHPFASQPVRSDVVRFVSVLSRRHRSTVPLPMRLPATGKWLLKILAIEGRFVFGMYRRHMKVISYLGRIDGVVGAPATTRNWRTIAAIAESLEQTPDTRSDSSKKRRPCT